LSDVKDTLRDITLALRHELEGEYGPDGSWRPGDIEQRLRSIGVFRNRDPVPADELQLTPEDRQARRMVDAFLRSRSEASQAREAAVSDLVRDVAYSWANRLLALRCMEARGLIDEVILQKDTYGGRSLQHHRLARRDPARCAGDDEGLFAVLLDEFGRRAVELPLVFAPEAPEMLMRPSVPALKRCVGLLSGTATPGNRHAATDETFTAPEALGWAYHYWNAEEKARVFAVVRTRRTKIEGRAIIPATCIYTEPYIVRFLVQNSLGATWLAMHPESRLHEGRDYWVPGTGRAAVASKPVREITVLDPACGSGHFLLEAFDLLWDMYLEEGITDPNEIAGSILENNLYGIDIDERAVQIAGLALFLRAREKAPGFVPRRVNLVATNIRLPGGVEHLDVFLRKHPDDATLRPALLTVFEALDHADELGSLLQLEEPVERELQHLKTRYEQAKTDPAQRSFWPDLRGPVQGRLPLGVDDYGQWKTRVLGRLRSHLEEESRAPDLSERFFGESAEKGLSLFGILERRYDVVVANPPYMGSKNMGSVVKGHVERHFESGKRDLYAAFMLRCLELATAGGRVGMVTQQSWMFLRSYAQLRALDEKRARDMPRTFHGVLRATSIEVLAHLGPRAFSDVTGEVVNTVAFVLAKTAPNVEHRLTAFRVVGPTSPEQKDRILRDAVRSLRAESGAPNARAAQL
jgi:hypothetical protein